MSRAYGGTGGAATDGALRLFVAIRLPDSVIEAVAGGTGTLRDVDGVRWTPLESLHVTLAFLGATPRGRLEAVAGVLRTVAGRRPPLALTVAGAGAFPSPERARVVWIGVDPVPALLALHADVVRGLGEIGFEPERRTYRPHVTLGRVARAGAAPRLPREIEAVGLRRSWEADRLSLMRSELGPGGARHEELRAFPFSRTVGAGADRTDRG